VESAEHRPGNPTGWNAATDDTHKFGSVVGISRQSTDIQTTLFFGYHDRTSFWFIWSLTLRTAFFPVLPPIQAVFTHCNNAACSVVLSMNNLCRRAFRARDPLAAVSQKWDKGPAIKYVQHPISVNYASFSG